MKRFAVPLVIAGSLAVLVALLVMLRSITSTAPAPAPTTRPPPTETAHADTTPATVAEARPTPSGPAPKGPAPTRSEPPPTLPPSGDSWAPAAGSDAPPGTKLNTKNLQFGLPQLREKIAANAPAVARCIGTSKPTGEATLTFIVAQRQGKVFIEQTDVDRDKTTLQDEKLIECLHRTALEIQLDGLPREAEAIIVTRSMTLQDGAVTEDKPVKFSYIR